MSKTNLKEIKPDFVHGSLKLSKFINYVMKKGQKATAQKIVYDALEIIKKKTKEDSLDVFERAIRNASPILEVRSRRIGGATYQVPQEVKGGRQFNLASRWILQAARAAKGKAMAEKLANELMAAAKEEGKAIQKKVNTHRMARANQAFAHFARRF